MLIFVQILFEVVRSVIDTMWGGIGRGRARGRPRTVDANKERRPGSDNIPAATEVEDWECGITTPYAVKSVTYTGPQQMVPVSQETYTHPPTQTSAISDLTPDIGVNLTHTNMAAPVIPPAAAVASKSRIYNARPPESDEYDSDESDVGGWDLGDNSYRRRQQPEAAPQQDSPASSGTMDIEEISQRNPGVSVTWLESILSKKTKNTKDIKPAVGGGKRQALWEETNLEHEIKAEADRWLKRVQSLWARSGSKSGLEMAQLLQQCFNTVQNPYVTTLYIMESVEDYRIPKASTVSHQVGREFEKWTKRNPEAETVLVRGGESLQVYAFYVGTRFHMTSFEVIARAFKLVQPDNDFFIPHIKPFIEQKRYKEACQCITKLDLQDKFDTKEILLPLILQDKINLVESYVYRRKKQQVELLQLLDHLCEEDLNLNKLADDSGVQDVMYQKLERKIISKLAIRLMKLYQIPQETCPNIDRKRSLSGLRYLVFKFYIEESLSRDTWRELVMSAADNNRWLQEQLLDELLTSHDIKEAVWFARHYALPASVIPEQVLQAMGSDDEMPSGVEGSEAADTEDWDQDLLTKPRFYYALQLPLSEVYFIDTRPAFYAALRYMVQTADMIGLDSEWRPMFGQEAKKRVALLQMATRDRAYLLDVIKLNQELSHDDWARLGQEVFLNSDIVKLGYGFETDLQMIAGSIPALRDPIIKAHKMIELQKLHKHVRKNPNVFKTEVPVEELPPNSALRCLKADEKGLSDMVRICLGRPLDKAEQMSDWENRPLRAAQVVYAALDAYVLIQLYEHVLSRADGLNTPLQLEPRVSAKSEPHRSRQQKRQARVAERQNMPGMAADSQTRAPVHGPPITPGELRVVVDTMIQGVGRYLRCCGIDTKILKTDEEHDAAAEISLRENRVILTCGQPYVMLSSRVSAGMCYQVNAGDKARKQAFDLLDHFNVKVTEADIFSRCPKCNGDRYAHIAPDEMQRAWDRAAQLARAGMKHPRTLPRRPAHKDITASQVCGMPGYMARTLDIKYEHINMQDVTLSNGVPLKVEAFPRDVTNKVSVFFCCTTCGKVFWEGSHYADIFDKFAGVLNRDREKWEETPEPDLADELNEMLTLKQ